MDFPAGPAPSLSHPCGSSFIPLPEVSLFWDLGNQLSQQGELDPLQAVAGHLYHCTGRAHVSVYHPAVPPSSANILFASLLP